MNFLLDTNSVLDYVRGEHETFVFSVPLSVLFVVKKAASCKSVVFWTG